MSGRTCEGCRWFQQVDSHEFGECRRYPPQHLGTLRGWMMVEQTAFCGEWTDGSITPQQAERRESVQQFALAIVQGMYANPEDISVQVAQQAQWFAREVRRVFLEGQQ